MNALLRIGLAVGVLVSMVAQVHAQTGIGDRPVSPRARQARFRGGLGDDPILQRSIGNDPRREADQQQHQRQKDEGVAEEASALGR